MKDYNAQQFTHH